jgi:hypothetical protein
LCPAARSQSEAERAFAVSPISAAKNLLSRLYPELSGKGYLAKVELDAPIDRDWTSTPLVGFVVTESIKVPSAKAGAAPTVFTEKVVLDALFGFDSDGILLNLHVHSSGILSDGKLDNLRQLVDPHRAWTDLQVGNALKRPVLNLGRLTTMR